MTMASPSWLALMQGRRAVHTLLLMLGVSVHAMNLHLVATVLPSVVADMGGAAFYAWATMLYTIASIIGTAAGGLIKATLGLRRGYLAGALVFLGGTVACAVAPHFAVLLMARTLQGLGSGLLMALVYSMIRDLYPETLRPLLLSALSGIWGIAALVGPLVGGVFAASGWWRGSFWAVTPVLMLLSGLAWYALPSVDGNAATERFPLLRLTLLGAGVLCMAWSGHVASLGIRLGLLASAIIFVAQTFSRDTRSANRLFPSQPLSLATPVGTAYWVFLLFGITTSQVTVFMPLFVQVLYGVSPLEAGYFTAILSMAWTVMALGSATLQDRRVRTVVLLGPLGMTCGVAGLGTFVVHGPLAILGLCMALTGAGIGVCYAHISSWSIAMARAEEGSLTASAIPMMQSLGIACGAAVAGLVANAAGLTAGLSPASVAAAATWVCGLGVVAPASLGVLTLRLLSQHRAASEPRTSRPGDRMACSRYQVERLGE